jgi:hypothetical protein
MACKWIHICPLREFERRGNLGLEWKSHYCENNFKECRRFQMEEKGIPHADNMLPDGTIDHTLT